MENNQIVESTIDQNIIQEKIYVIRGKRVMIDKDLAILYQVSTGQLNQSVNRNIDRFPDDFMFKMTSDEVKNLKSQIVISSHGGRRGSPLAFTEQGIAMLSSVLNSKRAIQVNIQIIRIFTRLREMVNTYKELREKVEEMERSNETNFREIFRVIKLLITEKEKPRNKIGFKAD